MDRTTDLAPKRERLPAKRPRRRSERARRPPTVDALWASYRRRPGDASRNRLVEAYQPLVKEVVRRFAGRLPRIVDRGDLETAANVGLIGAIEGFDPARGVRFEAYCELRVKGALLDELEYTGTHLAIAVNLEVVPRTRWADTELRDGDAVEILTPRQGG